MKYLNKLFAYDDRQSNQQSSATLTSTLYSVTFIPSQGVAVVGDLGSPSDSTISHQNRVTILAHDSQSAKYTTKQPTTKSTTNQRKAERDGSSLGSYLLTATIGKTIASTSAITSAINVNDEDDNNKETSPSSEYSDKTARLIEDDWILIEQHSDTTTTTTTPIITDHYNEHCKHNLVSSRVDRSPQKRRIRQMALDRTDVELIKASWLPVNKDPVAAGVLLFKGLFTKFPQYLKFFPQFSDLDVERMQENKRLLKHAVKVIETVGFVVDSIGDESKTTQLNEALVNLVKGHLKRKIGLSEFRNLGVVLIDFICDVNNRRGANAKIEGHGQPNRSSTSSSTSTDSSNHLTNDTETMTSALDKIRTSSSPSSSSEEESFLTGGHTTNTENSNLSETINPRSSVEQRLAGSGGGGTPASPQGDSIREAKIDTSLLVAAWTKLYSSILNLVEREEVQAAAK